MSLWVLKVAGALKEGVGAGRGFGMAGLESPASERKAAP